MSKSGPVSSVQSGNLRIGAGTELGEITVYYYSPTINYTKHTFVFPPGFKGSWNSGQLVIDEVPPTFPQNLANKTYSALFSSQNRNIFLGFYNKSYDEANGCTPKPGIINSDLSCLKEKTCSEGYLPEYIYKPNKTALYLAFLKNYGGKPSDPTFIQARDLVLKLEPLGLIKVTEDDNSSFSHLTLAKLLKALQAIDKALINDLTALKDVINTGDRCDMMYALWQLNRTNAGDGVFMSLPIAERKAALKKLANGVLTGSNVDTFWCYAGLNGGEESVSKLIKTTPTAEADIILSYLLTEKIGSTTLLTTFYKALDDLWTENFKTFVETVIEKYNELPDADKTKSQYITKIENETDIQNRIFQFSKYSIKSNNGYISDVEILENGNIQFKRTIIEYTGEIEEVIGGVDGPTSIVKTKETVEIVELSPFDVLEFNGYEGYQIFNTTNSNQNKKYPAIYLGYLKEKINSNKIMLGVKVAGFVLTTGAGLTLAQGGYYALAAIQGASSLGQLADLALLETQIVADKSELASAINTYNLVAGLVDFASIGNQAAALSKATSLINNLEVIAESPTEISKLAVAMDNFIIAYNKLKSVPNVIIPQEIETLKKWSVVQRLNFQRGPSSILFSNVFGTGGLYYQIFNDARLLNKLQKLEISQVEAFFREIKNLNLSPLAKTELQKDLLSNEAFFNAIVADGKLGKAWGIAIKHSKVRTSVTALTKIDNILSSGRIPSVKLKAAIDGNIGDILNAADDINLGKILDRLDLPHVNEAHFDELLQRLNNYPTLKQDLIFNPQWFETFDDILKEPGKYWDILNEGNLPSGSPLAQWGQGFWWKNLRDLADQFEDGSALTSFRTANNLNINQVVTQVTLEVNGIRIRIDYLGKDAAGKFHLGDAKFSTKTKDWITDWLNAATDNQTQVFPFFQSGGVNSIVVKATDSQKLLELANIGLANNSSISFANTTLKIFGSEANQQVVKTVVTLKP